MTKIEEISQRINEIGKTFIESLNECQKALAELKESKKEGKWKPKEGDEVWFRNLLGKPGYIVLYEDISENNGTPVFPTKEECERYWHFMDTVKEKSYEFSKEEWRNIKIPKYYIFYSNCEERLNVGLNWECRDLGEIYFKTEEDAKYIIDNFKDELMEYFL